MPSTCCVLNDKVASTSVLFNFWTEWKSLHWLSHSINKTTLLKKMYYHLFYCIFKVHICQMRKGDSRGWDSEMASLTQWTWIWANSGREWRTGGTGMLQPMGSQRAGHNLVIKQQICKQCLGTRVIDVNST